MSDDGDSLMEVARRGLTTTVGLGVLLFQNAQVQRRGLAKAAPRALQELGEVVGDRLKTLGEKLADLDDRAEDLFEDIEQRLPDGIRAPAREVHKAMREIRGLTARDGDGSPQPE